MCWLRGSVVCVVVAITESESRRWIADSSKSKRPAAACTTSLSVAACPAFPSCLGIVERDSVVSLICHRSEGIELIICLTP
jgi:hypothetical protein